MCVSTCTERGDRTSADQTRAAGKVAALMNVPAGRQCRECVITSGEALWSRKTTEPGDCYMLEDKWWGLHSRLHRGIATWKCTFNWSPDYFFS